MKPLQFYFDPKRCTGCEACVVGCWMENRAQQSQPWRRVRTYNAPHHPGLPVFHLSLACHHCDDPACMENCPAGAYSREGATGAVRLDPSRCMGCRYCTWACPHDAPRFDPARGHVEKCTFCEDRMERGLEPACVARCPMEALGVETRTAFRGVPPPGFPATSLGPGICFLPGPRPAPAMTAPPPAALATRFLREALVPPPSRITLRGEWSLVLFTTTLSVLVALRWAAAWGHPSGHPGWQLGAGLAAILLSAWHLGRPLRAYRAVANLRRSWLSREIALVNLFLGLSALQLLSAHPGRAWAWASALAGLAALYAVDRVYQVAMKAGPLNFHSAHTLLNGLYLGGILAGMAPLAWGAGLLKVFLYLFRKGVRRRQGQALRPLWSGLRIAAGFILPLLGGVLGAPPVLAALGAVLGDLVDRCEYYDELEILTPDRTLVASMLERAR